MAAAYRLFGLETSPFSIKVRSYLRYKKLPFDWVTKGYGQEEEFRALAKSDALPMLVSPNGGVAHDSSLILSKIEAVRGTPSAMPDDRACRALSSLLEDYADEWLNKAMFHYRWSSAKAAKAAAKRQAEQIFKGYTVEALDEIEKSIAKSMTARLKIVGLNKKNGEIIAASFERFITLLNAHLEHHLFLFGGHPSVADFALAGQLIQLLSDEISGDLIREKAPFVTAWCEFMEDPRSGAPFQDFDEVKDTLLPLIRDEVAPTYVAWSLANSASIAAKRKTLAVDTADGEFKQSVQNHSARAFDEVVSVFGATPETPALAEFLEAAGLSDVFHLADAASIPESIPEESPTQPDADDEAESGDETGESADNTPDQTASTDADPEGPPKPKRKPRRRRPRKPRSDAKSGDDNGSEESANGGADPVEANTSDEPHAPSDDENS